MIIVKISTLLLLALSIQCVLSLNRNEFPPNFIFGTATASYQIEGLILYLIYKFEKIEPFF